MEDWEYAWTSWKRNGRLQSTEILCHFVWVRTGFQWCGVGDLIPPICLQRHYSWKAWGRSLNRRVWGGPLVRGKLSGKVQLLRGKRGVLWHWMFLLLLQAVLQVSTHHPAERRILEPVDGWETAWNCSQGLVSVCTENWHWPRDKPGLWSFSCYRMSSLLFGSCSLSKTEAKS